MGAEPIKILLIEDNEQDRKLLQEALAKGEDSVFRLECADRLAIGLKYLTREKADLVLLDLLLPDSQGLDTIAKVHQQVPGVPIVVLTASDDDAIALQALQKGAHDYLVKGYVQVYPHLLGRAIRYTIERKRAADEVRNAHAQTEQLLSSLPSLLIKVNEGGLVTHWNVVAEKMFGISAAAAIHQPLSASNVRWDGAKILESIAACRDRQAPIPLDDVPFKRADGQEGFLGMTFLPMRGDDPQGSSEVLLFGADVTERKNAEQDRLRLQDELLQAQKMETIGRFAGGIAHDFNNFLQVILGFTWLIRARSKDDSGLQGDLQEIVHAAESASGMVHQLLAFSRRQPIQPMPLALDQTIGSMERLLQQLVGERIRVELALAPGPLVVKLDPTSIEQILMNLCANARDSMQEGGTLTIKTQLIVVDDAFVQRRPWWTKQGAFAQLSVQDTGVGMDPNVAAHIFEPFFTTKKFSKGTGLGLAVVYGLVKQHEGLIDIETAPGQGTTFHLYFPYQEISAEEPAALRPASAAGERPPEAVRREPEPPRGAAPRSIDNTRKRLLVVDDNPPIRVFCERIFQDSYYVTTVPSARAALDELARQPYDLLLTDLRMPNMDGVSLLQEVVKLNPHLKLLAMTGSLSIEMEQRLLSIPLGAQVIRKPFNAPTLLEAVNRCLS